MRIRRLWRERARGAHFRLIQNAALPPPPTMWRAVQKWLINRSNWAPIKMKFIANSEKWPPLFIGKVKPLGIYNWQSSPERINKKYRKANFRNKSWQICSHKAHYAVKNCELKNKISVLGYSDSLSRNTPIYNMLKKAIFPCALTYTEAESIMIKRAATNKCPVLDCRGYNLNIY